MLHWRSHWNKGADETLDEYMRKRLMTKDIQNANSIPAVTIEVTAETRRLGFHQGHQKKVKGCVCVGGAEPIRAGHLNAGEEINSNQEI